MKPTFYRLVSTLLALVFTPAFAQTLAPIHPPAVPLVTHDPYFSIWSMSDRLTDQTTKHWTGTDQPMLGIARIDGSAYRFMGTLRGSVPAMRQAQLQVMPTRTIYTFEQSGVRLRLTFLTPAFPDDLDVLSRPVTYISFDTQATDGNRHDVSIYFDAASQIATNTPEQEVQLARFRVGGLDVLRTGTTEQPVLRKSGDNLRIDWGFLYLAASRASGAVTLVAQPSATDQFVRTGTLPDADELDTQMYPMSRFRPKLICTFPLGAVSETAVTRHLLIGYDDLYSLQYFNRNLRPWWRRNGMNAAQLLVKAEGDYDAMVSRAKAFDEKLISDLTAKGGAKYAAIATLAFRQTLAAHKLVADFDGTPLYMSKENFSNGSIDTVDVLYPSAPFFLYFNPILLKGEITPILTYANMSRWRWSYAPHDLGTYPLANGQTYGGAEATEENQMPVEESGNILILMGALAKKDGNADYALKYWPLMTKWAQYLRDKGLDPENQLSTDDFAGHLAHNTNLSIKAIIALGSYGMMAKMAGKTSEAEEYSKLAHTMAAQWVPMAQEGDHFKLSFDRPGSWSQKYNLVWDRLLGLNLFSPDIARKEIAFYETKMNHYGLPLDNRETYTKLDWILWTATMAEKKSDFEALIDPVYDFLKETPTRVPMTDWYWTMDGKMRGFQARSVVGGVFIKMLAQ